MSLNEFVVLLPGWALQRPLTTMVMQMESLRRRHQHDRPQFRTSSVSESVSKTRCFMVFLSFSACGSEM